MKPSTRKINRSGRGRGHVFYPRIVHDDGTVETITGFQFDKEADAEDEARAEIDRRLKKEGGPR